MKRLPLILSLGLFVASMCCLSPATRADEVTLGAWNIEWLGYPDMRGRPGKGNAQKPSDLAERIHQSHADILALEEIGVESTETLRSKELDATFAELKKTFNEDWEYLLFAKTQYPDESEDFQIRGQHIGVAWNKARANKVGEPFEIPVGTNETFGLKFWERRANAVKFSFGEGKTDVVVVPVHLKSNRNDEHPEDKDWTRKHRAAEAERFVEKLDVLQKQFKDEDVVILGDFNFLADDDQGAQTLEKAGFKDLNSADEGTTAAWGEGYSSAPFDRIFVTSSQPEFQNSKLEILRTEKTDDDSIKAYRRRFSDHYIVTTKVEVTTDDDQ